MAYDSLIWLSGTTSDPTETVTATGNGSAKDCGADRVFEAELRIGGAVSGPSPTLTVTIEESTDGSTGWGVIATFAQETTSDRGSSDYAVPGSAPQKRWFRTSKRYVRWVKTAGGTTPSFGGTSCVLIPHLEQGI
jgi:hypothetical protein